MSNPLPNKVDPFAVPYPEDDEVEDNAQENAGLANVEAPVVVVEAAATTGGSGGSSASVTVESISSSARGHATGGGSGSTAKVTGGGGSVCSPLKCHVSVSPKEGNVVTAGGVSSNFVNWAARLAANKASSVALGGIQASDLAQDFVGKTQLLRSSR